LDETSHVNVVESLRQGASQSSEQIAQQSVQLSLDAAKLWSETKKNKKDEKHIERNVPDGKSKFTVPGG
jgi:hypothetical protein